MAASYNIAVEIDASGVERGEEKVIRSLDRIAASADRLRNILDGVISKLNQISQAAGNFNLFESSERSLRRILADIKRLSQSGGQAKAIKVSPVLKDVATRFKAIERSFRSLTLELERFMKGISTAFDAIITKIDGIRLKLLSTTKKLLLGAKAVCKQLKCIEKLVKHVDKFVKSLNSFAPSSGLKIRVAESKVVNDTLKKQVALLREISRKTKPALSIPERWLYAYTALSGSVSFERFSKTKDRPATKLRDYAANLASNIKNWFFGNKDKGSIFETVQQAAKEFQDLHRRPDIYETVRQAAKEFQDLQGPLSGLSNAAEKAKETIADLAKTATNAATQAAQNVQGLTTRHQEWIDRGRARQEKRDQFSAWLAGKTGAVQPTIDAATQAARRVADDAVKATQQVINTASQVDISTTLDAATQVARRVADDAVKATQQVINTASQVDVHGALETAREEAIKLANSIQTTTAQVVEAASQVDISTTLDAATHAANKVISESQKAADSIQEVVDILDLPPDKEESIKYIPNPTQVRPLFEYEMFDAQLKAYAQKIAVETSEAELVKMYQELSQINQEDLVASKYHYVDPGQLDNLLTRVDSLLLAIGARQEQLHNQSISSGEFWENVKKMATAPPPEPDLAQAERLVQEVGIQEEFSLVDLKALVAKELGMTERFDPSIKFDLEEAKELIRDTYGLNPGDFKFSKKDDMFRLLVELTKQTTGTTEYVPEKTKTQSLLEEAKDRIGQTLEKYLSLFGGTTHAVAPKFDANTGLSALAMNVAKVLFYAVKRVFESGFSKKNFDREGVLDKLAKLKFNFERGFYTDKQMQTHAQDLQAMQQRFNANEWRNPPNPQDRKFILDSIECLLSFEKPKPFDMMSWKEFREASPEERINASDKELREVSRILGVAPVASWAQMGDLLKETSDALSKINRRFRDEAAPHLIEVVAETIKEPYQDVDLAQQYYNINLARSALRGEKSMRPGTWPLFRTIAQERSAAASLKLEYTDEEMRPLAFAQGGATRYFSRDAGKFITEAIRDGFEAFLLRLPEGLRNYVFPTLRLGARTAIMGQLGMGFYPGGIGPVSPANIGDIGAFARAKTYDRSTPSMPEEESIRHILRKQEGEEFSRSEQVLIKAAKFIGEKIGRFIPYKPKDEVLFLRRGIKYVKDEAGKWLQQPLDEKEVAKSAGTGVTRAVLEYAASMRAGITQIRDWKSHILPPRGRLKEMARDFLTSSVQGAKLLKSIEERVLKAHKLYTKIMQNFFVRNVIALEKNIFMLQVAAVKGVANVATYLNAKFGILDAVLVTFKELFTVFKLLGLFYAVWEGFVWLFGNLIKLGTNFSYTLTELDAVLHMMVGEGLRELYAAIMSLIDLDAVKFVLKWIGYIMAAFIGLVLAFPTGIIKAIVEVIKLLGRTLKEFLNTILGIVYQIHSWFDPRLGKMELVNRPDFIGEAIEHRIRSRRNAITYEAARKTLDPIFASKGITEELEALRSDIAARGDRVEVMEMEIEFMKEHERRFTDIERRIASETFHELSSLRKRRDLVIEINRGFQDIQDDERAIERAFQKQDLREKEYMRRMEEVEKRRAQFNVDRGQAGPGDVLIVSGIQEENRKLKEQIEYYRELDEVAQALIETRADLNDAQIESIRKQAQENRVLKEQHQMLSQSIDTYRRAEEQLKAITGAIERARGDIAPAEVLGGQKSATLDELDTARGFLAEAEQKVADITTAIANIPEFDPKFNTVREFFDEMQDRILELQYQLTQTAAFPELQLGIRDGIRALWEAMEYINSLRAAVKRTVNAQEIGKRLEQRVAELPEGSLRASRLISAHAAAYTSAVERLDQEAQMRSQVLSNLQSAIDTVTSQVPGSLEETLRAPIENLRRTAEAITHVGATIAGLSSKPVLVGQLAEAEGVFKQTQRRVNALIASLDEIDRQIKESEVLDITRLQLEKQAEEARFSLAEQRMAVLPSVEDYETILSHEIREIEKRVQQYSDEIEGHRDIVQLKQEKRIAELRESLRQEITDYQREREALDALLKQGEITVARFTKKAAELSRKEAEQNISMGQGTVEDIMRIYDADRDVARLAQYIHLQDASSRILEDERQLGQELTLQERERLSVYYDITDVLQKQYDLMVEIHNKTIQARLELSALDALFASGGITAAAYSAMLPEKLIAYYQAMAIEDPSYYAKLIEAEHTQFLHELQIALARNQGIRLANIPEQLRNKLLDASDQEVAQKRLEAGRGGVDDIIVTLGLEKQRILLERGLELREANKQVLEQEQILGRNMTTEERGQLKLSLFINKSLEERSRLMEEHQNKVQEATIAYTEFNKAVEQGLISQREAQDQGPQKTIDYYQTMIDSGIFDPSQYKVIIASQQQQAFNELKKLQEQASAVRKAFDEGGISLQAFAVKYHALQKELAQKRLDVNVGDVMDWTVSTGLQEEIDLLQRAIALHRTRQEVLDYERVKGLPATDNEAAFIENRYRTKAIAQARFDLMQDPFYDLDTKLEAARGAYGETGLRRYADEIRKVQVEMATLKVEMGDTDWSTHMLVQVDKLTNGFKSLEKSISEAVAAMVIALEDGFANSVSRAIVYAEDFGESLRELTRSAIAEFIKAMVKMGMEWAAHQAMGMFTIGTATPAVAVAGAGGAAAGGGVVGGLVGLVRSILPFSEGTPYVYGPGTSTSDSVLARLSVGEGVVNARANRANPGLVASMNAGTVFSAHGNGPAAKTELNITIENHGTDVQVERITENDIRIIARQEADASVRREAPKVIASNIARSNSTVSKSLAQNTKTQRRRV
jgi:hypothetical protein